MGPVISKTAAQQLLDQQEDLLARGGIARLALESEPESSVYLRPGIIDVGGVSDIQDEELFGPLLQVPVSTMPWPGPITPGSAWPPA